MLRLRLYRRPRAQCEDAQHRRMDALTQSSSPRGKGPEKDAASGASSGADSATIAYVNVGDRAHWRRLAGRVLQRQAMSVQVAVFSPVGHDGKSRRKRMRYFAIPSALISLEWRVLPLWLSRRCRRL